MDVVKQRESWVGEEGLGESVRETLSESPPGLPCPFQLSRDQLFPAANRVWRKHNRVVTSEKLLRSWVTSSRSAHGSMFTPLLLDTRVWVHFNQTVLLPTPGFIFHSCRNFKRTNHVQAMLHHMTRIFSVFPSETGFCVCNRLFQVRTTFSAR